MSESNQKQTFIQNFILFFVDLLCICLAYALAIITRGIQLDFERNTQYYILILFFLIILELLTFFLLSIHTDFFQRGDLSEFFGTFK